MRFLTRRGFLSALAGLGGGALARGATALEQTGPGALPETPGVPGRLAEAFEVRLRAAQLARDRGAAPPTPNGDEAEIPGRIACSTKALPHDAQGVVDARSYEILLSALRTGKPEDFERIPLGGFVKLANPQAAWAFDLLGPDCSQVQCPPAPRFSSAEQAAELAELYWQALVRDVPFADYSSHPLTVRAAEDLSRLSDFHGPKRDGDVIPGTLFRGSASGDLVGPYLSQFLWKPIPFTPLKVEAKIRTAVPGVDYMTGWDDWLAIQNGALSEVNRFEPAPLFIRTGRDLGEYVHRDFTYQAFLGACLIALKAGTLPDGGNPYKHSRTQGAFTTFGQPYLLHLLAVVTQMALKACWYQKWLVHRRLRPEELAGRVEAHFRGATKAPVHASLFSSAALEETRKRFATALLAQPYPEGSPTHPSYPSGHAAIAGACATVLKACLDESHILPEPVVASPDGLSLQPWKGPSLTVGGELDKLASNIALGRGFGGVHWRSDSVEGLKLGEEVAIRLLEEQSLTGNELFSGFSLRRFDGRRVSVV
jgi:membrane-associated phospholipid phosphatase